MELEDESINFTLLTTGSSNDETMFNPGVQKADYDSGVLHMIGCYGDEELERDIEDKTRYTVVHYPKPRTEETIRDLISELVDLGYREKHYAVLPDFQRGDLLLTELQKNSIRVISPVLIRQCITINKALSSISRLAIPSKRNDPLYSRMMTGLTICFTNFHLKEELTYMRWMVQVLGGKVAKEYDPALDNIILIANSAGREKFETAMAVGNPVLKVEWLNDCFQLRKDPNALPRLMYAEDNIRYSCPIFYRFKFFLIGFKHEDSVDINENCRNYGAVVVSDAKQMGRCSHIILCVPDNSDMSAYLPYIEELKRIRRREREPRTEIVNDKWFYESVSLCSLLSVNNYLVEITPDGELDFKPEPRDRKRRPDGVGEIRPHKKRSSEAANCSVYSNISITGPLPGTPNTGTPKTPLKCAPVDKRDNVISEFIRTEETYVRHLQIIQEKYYKYVYEEKIKTRAETINLELRDIHIMFQHIPPIRIVHTALLKELEKYEVSEKLRKDYRSNRQRSFGKILLNWIGKDVVENENGKSYVDLSRQEMLQLFTYEKNETRDWIRMEKGKKDDAEKGKTPKFEGIFDKGKTPKLEARVEGNFLKKLSGEQSEEHPDVLRHYNVYMNAHEGIVEQINQSVKACFRFKTILKTEGAKKENDRLGIRDLMIEPVQRLPRFILLLDAIIKKTEKKHGDLEMLELAREEFKKATAFVNDTKRRLDQKKDFVNFLVQISGLPEGTVSTNKHNLVEQYHFKLYQEYGNLPPDTDVGIWLFILDEEETSYNQDDDSVLEIAYMPQRKTGSVSGGTAERSLRSLSKSFCYKHVLHIPLRTVVNVCEVHHQMELIGLGIEYRTDPNTTERIVFRFVNDEFLVGGTSLEKRAKLRTTLVNHVNRSRVQFTLPPIPDDMDLSEDNIRKLCSNKLSDSCRDLRSKPSFLEKMSGRVARALTMRQSNKSGSSGGTLQKAHSLANLTPSKKSESKVRLMRDSH